MNAELHAWLVWLRGVAWDAVRGLVFVYGIAYGLGWVAGIVRRTYDRVYWEDGWW